MKKAILLGAALAAPLMLSGLSPLHAQTYPAHNITMIVPFPAGGPSDIVARIAAEGMSKQLGTNIVIENVGGAGGTIGATRAAEAKPDGYTVFAASMGTIIAAPTFYPNLKYDSNNDFEPIGMSANAPAAGPLSSSCTGARLASLTWVRPPLDSMRKSPPGMPDVLSAASSRSR